MQEFERRIAALEAEVQELRAERRRRSRLTFAVAALALCGLGLARNANRASFEELQTRKLVLTDENGEKRGELSVDKDGAGRLELFGTEANRPDRTPFASLASQRGGGQLDLASTEGGTTATLGAGFGETWGGFLRLASDGYPVVSLWTQDGTANFQMIDSDEEGGFLCGTRSVSSGRAGWMELRNGKGEPAMYLLSGEKGEGVVELYDAKGEAKTLRAPKARDGNGKK